MSEDRSDDELEAFDAASADALDTEVVKGAASDEDVAAGLARERLTRAQQENTHRSWFVRWVIGVVTGTLVAGIGIMVAYICSEWSETDPSVLIAWFSASVVQTIGLAYVIANYLFPKERTES
ncbi:hypothetical protein [Cellulomonas endometrii]|uniref:hypothetical protein n=1 Tax=Cellulomonas endometrii TaxID=3036301 RepID=UPI0024AD8320|nr:hypothetical protein [Cellulomonas endometrii]